MRLIQIINPSGDRRVCLVEDDRLWLIGEYDSVYALAQAALELRPFAAGDDVRDDVEGDEPLRARSLAIDSERDADAMEEETGRMPVLRDAIRRRLREPVAERVVMRPHIAVAVVHLVVERSGLGLGLRLGLGHGATAARSKRCAKE